MQWKQIFAKLEDRASIVSKSRASVSLAAYAYNTRVATTTSYVSQLIPLPPNSLELERRIFHKVTGFATSAIGHADFLNLRQGGGPKLHSFCVAGAAALFRTATKTVTCWPSWLVQLRAAALEGCPLALWARGDLTPPFWDSVPIAANLEWAFNGFHGHPKWESGVKKFIPDVLVPPGSPPVPRVPGGLPTPNNSRRKFTSTSSMTSFPIPSKI